jgi:Holliday junction resolvase RusA-like endonuclease
MKLIVPGELITLNEYIKLERGNKFAAAKSKKEETELVYWSCVEQGLQHQLQQPCIVAFYWYAKNMKKDLDNISFGAKAILDGCKEAGVLYDDGFEWVKGLKHYYRIDRENPRVEVQFITI